MDPTIAALLAVFDALMNQGQVVVKLLNDAHNGVKPTPQQLDDLSNTIQSQSDTIQSLRGPQG